MAAPSSRMSWIDFAKGLLMILVFVYHSEVIYGNGHSWSWLFAMFFLTGFFTLSGYLFTADLDKVSFQRKALQTLRGIVIPYLIFTIVLLIPRLILVLDNPEQAIIDIVLFRASWFVNVIAMLTLLFSGVIILFKNRNMALHLITIASVIISYLFVILYRWQPEWVMEPMFWNSTILPNHMPFCINLTFMAAPFYSLGIYYRLYLERKYDCSTWGKCLIVWVLYFALMFIDHATVSSSLVFAVNTMKNVPLVYLYSIIAIIGVVMFSKLIGEVKVVNYIGQNSIIFYFLNALMLRVVSLVVSNLSLTEILAGGGIFSEVLVALLAVALTFPVVWTIKKHLPIVVGNKDSFNKLSRKLGWNINW